MKKVQGNTDEGPYYIIEKIQFFTTANLVLQWLRNKYRIELDNHIDDCLVDQIDRNEKYAFFKKLIFQYKTFDQLLELATKHATKTPNQILLEIAHQIGLVSEVMGRVSNKPETTMFINRQMFDIFEQYKQEN